METTNFNNQQVPLPNATATLVLGILSIAICGFIGLALGIVALILSNKDKKLITENPLLYTQGSVSNSNAGRTCAIIGVIVSSIVSVGLIIYIIAAISFFGEFARVGY